MDEDFRRTAAVGLGLIAAGALLVYLAFDASAASEVSAARAIALAAVRRVPLNELQGHDGEMVAVRGWPVGKWPVEEEVAFPVVACEGQYREKRCKNVDGKEQCKTEWRRFHRSPPAEFLLLPEPPVAGAAELDATRGCLVRPKGAAFPGMTRSVDEADLEVSCVRADREVTVFGRVQGRAISAGEPFLVSNGTPNDLSALEQASSTDASSSVVWRAVFAGVFLLAGLAVIAQAVRERYL